MERAESDRDGSKDRREDGFEPHSYEAWKRRLQGDGHRGAAGPSLRRVLEKMVSLSELMGKLEEQATPIGADELFIVAGRGRRSKLSLETLDRWIDIEGGAG